MEKFYLSLNTQNAGGDDVATWIQLTPLGTFQGEDGRGPFIIDDSAKVIANSFAKHKKLAIDINHAIDLKGVKGEEAPAIGWIDTLEARHDGIYGKVEWTQRGKAIMAAHEYGFISPVLMTSKGKPARVISIARASLVNDPNLKDLKSLHSNGDTLMLEQLRKALNLPDSDEAAILEAVKSLNMKAANYDGLVKDMQSALKSDENDPKVLLTSLQAKQPSQPEGDDPEKLGLQQQVGELVTQLNAIQTEAKRERAEAFVNQAIKDFRITPTLKDHFISRHMRDAGEVEAEINAVPAMMSNGLKNYVPSEGHDGLSAQDKHICSVMGIDPKDFAATQKKEIL